MPGVQCAGGSRTALGFSPLYAKARRSQTLGHLLVRPVGRPPKRPRRFYHSFDYQAKSWDHPRRVVAKVEWHQGELFPRVGFIVTNLGGSASRHRKFPRLTSSRSASSNFTIGIPGLRSFAIPRTDRVQ